MGHEGVGFHSYHVFFAEGEANWMTDAACQDEDGRFFFQDGQRRGDTKYARSVCMGCPVREECLEFALRNYEHGVWGGTTEKQREHMRAIRGTDTLEEAA